MPSRRLSLSCYLAGIKVPWCRHAISTSALQALLLFAVTFLFAYLTLIIRIRPTGLTPYWFGSGISLGALLLSRRSKWPWFIAAIFIGNYLATNITNDNMVTTFLFALANTVEPLIAASMIYKFSGNCFFLEKASDFMVLLGSVLTACAISSLIGMAGAMAYDKQGDAFAIWYLWFVEVILGMLLLTPLLVLTAKYIKTNKLKSTCRDIEGWLFVAAPVAMTIILFSSPTMESIRETYLLFPVFSFIALRCDRLFCIIASLGTSICAITLTVLNFGPFYFFHDLVSESFIFLQLFLIVLIGSTLLLSLINYERQTAISAKRTKQSILETLIEQAGDAIIGFHKTENYSFTNKAARNLIAKSSEPLSEMVASTLYDVNSNKEISTKNYKMLDQLKAAMNEDRTVRYEVRLFNDEQKKQIDYLATATPIKAASKVADGGVLVLTDVTKQKELTSKIEELYEKEKQANRHITESLELAQKSNKMKDEFLAVLSHELRTPMSVIHGWTELLQDMKTLPEDAANIIATIKRNAKLELDLIEELLDIARVASGKITLKREPINVWNFVQECTDSIQPSLQNKDIKLDLINYDQNLPFMIMGDYQRLSQALNNLLTNAIKFSTRGSHVSINISKQDQQACIKVADVGAGISPEFLPHVFDTFRQEDSSGKRSFGGLGLGLAVTKQIVELHGGRVIAFSAGKGKGSTFSMCLPLLANSHATKDYHSKDAETEKQSQQLNGRILLIDDNRDLLQLTKCILTYAGATVDCAVSVPEAFELLRTNAAYHTIICDIEMPEQGGYDFIKKFKENNGLSWGSTPVIALTAHAHDDDRFRALAEGFYAYIKKPFEAKELINTSKKAMAATVTT